MNWLIIFLVWILIAAVFIGLYMLIARWITSQSISSQPLGDLHVGDITAALLTPRDITYGGFYLCLECDNVIAPDEYPYCIDCFERLERGGFFDAD